MEGLLTQRSFARAVAKVSLANIYCTGVVLIQIDSRAGNVIISLVKVKE